MGEFQNLPGVVSHARCSKWDAFAARTTSLVSSATLKEILQGGKSTQDGWWVRPVDMDIETLVHAAARALVGPPINPVAPVTSTRPVIICQSGN